MKNMERNHQKNVKMVKLLWHKLINNFLHIFKVLIHINIPIFFMVTNLWSNISFVDFILVSYFSLRYSQNLCGSMNFLINDMIESLTYNLLKKLTTIMVKTSWELLINFKYSFSIASSSIWTTKQSNYDFLKDGWT